MAWDPVLWIIFSVTNLTLLGLNFYQFLGFSDLESDYLNPYELSSRVNYVIVPEYLLHIAFCILFLVTGHWIMFLLALPPAYYNLKQYLSKQHLIDVTEVFKVVGAEKKARILKLGFYVIFFGLVITRLALSVVHAVFADDDGAVNWLDNIEFPYAVRWIFKCLSYIRSTPSPPSILLS